MTLGPGTKRPHSFDDGCVSYEALTGRKAFAAETVSDKIAAVHRAAEGLQPVGTQRAARWVLPPRLQDLDEALGYAARIPSARFGAVEVRPVAVYGVSRKP